MLVSILDQAHIREYTLDVDQRGSMLQTAERLRPSHGSHVMGPALYSRQVSPTEEGIAESGTRQAGLGLWADPQPGATVGVAAAMQGQADRLCSVVPEPVVLPAPTQRAVAPLAFC